MKRMTHVIIHVLLTPIVSNNQILVPTLPRNDQIVDANNIDQAAFPLDSSGKSSVSKGIVWASMKTGRKNKRSAAKNNVKI